MEYSEFCLTGHAKEREIDEKDYCCDCCILPSNYKWSSAIIENNKRKCKYCQEFKIHRFLGKDSFISDLDLKDNERVCIAVSGGKDSVFAWKKLVEMLGSDKVVACAYVKNRLTHKYAIENIKEASRILNSKCYILEDSDAYIRFKKNLESLLNKPDPSMVRVALCSGCRYGITKNIYDYIYDKEGITKYVSAASYLELAPFKEELLIEKGLGSSKDGLIKGLLENDGYSFGCNKDIILRDHDFKYKGNLSTGGNFTNFGKYRLYDFDLYFENNPEEIEKEISRELNWKRPERSWHFDCLIEQFKDFFYYGLLGYTETNFKLSAMIRNNLISRVDAVNELKRYEEKLENSLCDIIDLMRELEVDYLIPKMKDFYSKSIYLNKGKREEMFDVVMYIKEDGYGTGVNVSSNHLMQVLNNKGINTGIRYYTNDDDLIDKIGKCEEKNIILQALTLSNDTIKKVSAFNKKIILATHSTICNLQVEGDALSRLFDLMDIDKKNIYITCPSKVEVDGFNSYSKLKFYYLPNTYSYEISDDKVKRAIMTRSESNVIRISIFCAIRAFKNILQQITAVSLLSKKIPNIELHLLEGKDYLSDCIDKMIEKLAFSVVRHKECSNEELLQIMSRMHIGMQVSLSETFSYVAYEHMCYGVPVVASTSIPYANVLVDYSDSTKICDAMYEIIKDKDKYIDICNKTVVMAKEIRNNINNDAIKCIEEIINDKENNK